MIPELRLALDDLERLSNVQLFASWDQTMPEPPENWRVSFVGFKYDLRQKKILDCPEQYQLSKPLTCAECGYCLSKKDGDVFFVLH